MEIEATGEWWNPGNPAVRWAGTLRISKDGEARLSLNDPPGPQTLFREHGEYDALHGITNEGKRITLLRCFDISTGGPVGGLGKRDVHANVALIGIHAEGPDPLLSGATAVIADARVWFGRSNLRVANFTSMQKANLAYEAPPAIILYEQDGLTLKMYATLTSLPSALDDDGEFEIREQLRFELDSVSPRPLSELNCVLEACRDLLSIACQDYCAADSWLVYQGTGRESREASYHAAPIFRGKRRGPRNLFFRFDDIAAAPQEYFTNWLNQADRLAEIRSLYFLAIYGDQFVQGRFLALTQAIEAFHRRYRPGVYMPDESFATMVAAPLVAAIPPGLDRSLLNALQSRIRFGNEFSLRKRVGDLFNEHRAALGVVIDHHPRLVSAIVDRRNRFTHFPVDSLNQDNENDDWLGYNAVVRLLLELCFMKLIGFKDETLAELVRRGHDRAQLIRRFITRKE